MGDRLRRACEKWDARVGLEGWEWRSLGREDKGAPQRSLWRVLSPATAASHRPLLLLCPQGHANAVSCLCVSEDRRWVATADRGPDALIVVWDSFSG